MMVISEKYYNILIWVHYLRSCKCDVPNNNLLSIYYTVVRHLRLLIIILLLSNVDNIIVPIIIKFGNLF